MRAGVGERIQTSTRLSTDADRFGNPVLVGDANKTEVEREERRTRSASCSSWCIVSVMHMSSALALFECAPKG